MKESDKFLLHLTTPLRGLVGMRSKFAMLFISLLFLASCNNNSEPKDTRPVVGSFDSIAIAADTVMQLGLEQSYEYNKTLKLNNNAVYDIIAWGTPTRGKISFVYRDDKGMTDTVLETERLGIIKECWLSDMNGNGNTEVMAVLQNNDSRKLQSITAVEVGEKRNATDIKFEVQLPKEVLNKYRGNDAITYVQEENALYHSFPLMDSTVETGRGTIKYVLKGNKFEAVKFQEKK